MNPPPCLPCPKQDIAEADAAVLEDADGMGAKVQLPSTHLIRIWITIKPWRLYKGLRSMTVEALGLDPKKGVQASVYSSTATPVAFGEKKSLRRRYYQ